MLLNFARLSQLCLVDCCLTFCLLYFQNDKTSVLIKAASYLKTLESQISGLQETNHKLESYLPNTNGGDDATIRSNERVQIQILRMSCAEPHVHQINLRINVVQKCDVAELVLHILECLKLMRSISLVSVDAYTFSPHMKLHAKASIKLHMKVRGFSILISKKRFLLLYS
jgi:hypothetical protein